MFAHFSTNLPDRSREMTDLLIEKGVGQGHPIIWVGHSKGGIFIKKILVDAWESGRQAAADLWRSSRGVFFYSVPHRGSILASLKPPLTARSIELIEIQKSEYQTVLFFAYFKISISFSSCRFSESFGAA